MILSKDVEAQALQLPLEERARLVDRLIRSLEAPVEGEWHAALDVEVTARMEAAERGEIATVDGRKTLSAMWDLLR